MFEWENWQIATIVSSIAGREERERIEKEEGQNILAVVLGFCGVQAHRIHSVWQRQTAHHFSLSPISEAIRENWRYRTTQERSG